MAPRKGDIVFDQDLLERLCKATGVSKSQMRHWITYLAEGLEIELPRHGQKGCLKGDLAAARPPKVRHERSPK